MTRTKQLQSQQQPKQQRRQQQHKRQLQLLLLLCLGLLQLLPTAVASPQQQLLLQTAPGEQTATATAPGLNDPSDLSAGLNLVPVSNWIAAAANAEPPAPVQFVRLAMNSGL